MLRKVVAGGVVCHNCGTLGGGGEGLKNGCNGRCTADFFFYGS